MKSVAISYNSVNMWLDINIVLFSFSMKSLKILLSFDTDIGSIPFVGSSKINKSGFFKKAIPNPSFCFVPSDKFLAFFFKLSIISSCWNISFCSIPNSIPSSIQANLIFSSAVNPE